MSTERQAPVQELIDIHEQDSVSGYRLDYFEAYNWGTFHERVGRAQLDGQTTLLTGENGAGKSTLADGIVTLLVATNKRNYNAASGEAKRERSETDYIRGNLGNLYNEVKERDEPVFLRADGQYYTVLLAVFRNRREDKAVSLAQVLWVKSNGETAKVFIVEQRAMTIVGDLAGFANTGTIRDTLKERKLECYDNFKSYSERFHRLLKLNADRNPMGIFNQTIAVKDIKNLTEFIRSYMLESGLAQEHFAKLKERVRELRNTYQMIKIQKEQLAVLETISSHVRTVMSARELAAKLTTERAALEPFFAKIELKLRLQLSADNNVTLKTLTDTKGRLGEEAGVLEAQLQAYRQQQRSSSHGAVLQQLEADIKNLEQQVGLLKKNKDRFERDLGVLHPSRRVETADAFAAFMGHLPAEIATLTGQEPELEKAEQAQRDQVASLSRDFQATEKEIGSLIAQHTALPQEALGRRDYIAEQLGIPKGRLPFVGELMRVYPGQERWTGAIERLLHSFALTILVHNDEYQTVDAFVSVTGMRGRIEYFPVPAAVATTPRLGESTVAGKVEIKPDAGIFGRYIQKELAHRFDHVCCEATNQLWEQAAQALTITGLFKGRSGRRIKDDRHDINDRRTWVLGWDNQAKLALLREQLKTLTESGTKAMEAYKTAQQAKRGHAGRLNAAKSLQDSGFTFDQINPQAVVIDIVAKQAQRDALKKDPELEKLSRNIATTEKQLKAKKEAYETAIGNVRTKEDEETQNLEAIGRLETVCANISAAAEDCFILIRKRLDLPVQRLAEIAPAQGALYRAYSTELEDTGKTVTGQTMVALAKMGAAINHEGWQHLHDELGSAPPTELSTSCIERFQRVENRIRTDDIPKNEEKFKRLLQETVIDDFNTFTQSLQDLEQRIQDRIVEINVHLSKVDFDRRVGQETYIRLIPEKTKTAAVRDFRASLKYALTGILNIDESIEARETCFHQVNSLIEKLDADPKTRDVVIDVRNWFDFKAEERYREGNRPKETYQGAIGKSGGEKSRLASTILATAIAYQYDIDIDRPEGDTFRFVLIDEALNRIGDEFSQYLFDVFARFHLQLLIIHPRDAKLHITEKFVTRYNVVLKPNKYSSLVNMTVHEFQAFKAKFAA